MQSPQPVHFFRNFALSGIAPGGNFRFRFIFLDFDIPGVSGRYSLLSARPEMSSVGVLPATDS